MIYMWLTVVRIQIANQLTAPIKRFWYCYNKYTIIFMHISCVPWIFNKIFKAYYIKNKDNFYIRTLVTYLEEDLTEGALGPN